MIKRVLAILLVTIMLLGLCACGKGDPADSIQSTTTPTAVTTATAPTDPAPNRILLQTMLDKRDVPPLKSREEMLTVLQSEVYGTMPAAPTKVEFATKEKIVENY